MLTFQQMRSIIDTMSRKDQDLRAEATARRKAESELAFAKSQVAELEAKLGECQSARSQREEEWRGELSRRDRAEAEWETRLSNQAAVQQQNLQWGHQRNLDSVGQDLSRAQQEVCNERTSRKSLEEKLAVAESRNQDVEMAEDDGSLKAEEAQELFDKNTRLEDENAALSSLNSKAETDPKALRGIIDDLKAEKKFQQADASTDELAERVSQQITDLKKDNKRLKAIEVMYEDLQSSLRSRYDPPTPPAEQTFIAPYDFDIAENMETSDPRKPRTNATNHMSKARAGPSQDRTSQILRSTHAQGRRAVSKPKEKEKNAPARLNPDSFKDLTISQRLIQDPHFLLTLGAWVPNIRAAPEGHEMLDQVTTLFNKQKYGEIREKWTGILLHSTKLDTVTLFSPHGSSSVLKVVVEINGMTPGHGKQYMPPREMLEYVKPEDYVEACLLAQLPEVHLAALNRAWNDPADIRCQFFSNRFPYNGCSKLPSFGNKLDSIMEDTIKELSGLEQFTNACIGFAYCNKARTDFCWPPTFKNAKFRKLTVFPWEKDAKATAVSEELTEPVLGALNKVEIDEGVNEIEDAFIKAFVEYGS